MADEKMDLTFGQDGAAQSTEEEWQTTDRAAGKEM